jgi:ribosome-binding factor A
MSNRLLRVNEMLQREISAYLRKRYTSETTELTITGADVTGDLREAKIYFSVVGSEPAKIVAAGRFLKAKTPEIRSIVAKNVVMRHVPLLTFVHDASGERALRIESLLDELDKEDEK